MEDIGKASLAVLLVMCLLVSIVSTFMVLDSLNMPKTKVHQVKVTQTSQGVVGLSIAQTQPVERHATVSLSIQR
jgi:hypothetical protein